MTKAPDWDALEVELLAHISQQFDSVSAGGQPYKGVHIVLLRPKRLLSRNEVIAAWKEMAPIIRRKVPERSDGWAIRIIAERLFGPAMGAFEMGWEGRDDRWVFFGDDTQHADWLALQGRLREALLAHGREGDEVGGDFSLLEEDNGLAKLTVYVHRIELLTEPLIGDIQALLRDGYMDWSIEAKLMLSPSLGDVPSDGTEIWGDGMQENWDRKRLKRILGERLKI